MRYLSFFCKHFWNSLWILVLLSMGLTDMAWAQPTLTGSISIAAENEVSTQTGSTAIAVSSLGTATPATSGRIVTAVNDQSKGSWQYSTDGSTWTAISLGSQVLPLEDTHQIRFYMDANENTADGNKPSITVKAWDKTGGTAGTLTTESAIGSSAISTASLTGELTINNVNNAPTALDPASASVVENVAAGKLVDLGATDLDASDTHTFTLPTHTKFEIQNNDELHLKSGQTLDYETTTSYSLSITVTDAGGLTGTFNFTLTVTNVNEAPTGLNPTSASIAENSTGKLADLGATDPDASDTHTFTLTSTVFEIKNDDELHLISGQTLDYETTTSYTLSITATDAGSLTGTFNFTLTVTNVNEAPTGLNPSSASVAENSTGKLADLGATDPDASDTHTFTLTSTVFEIKNDDELHLISGQALDFETTTSYTLSITATDAGSLTGTFTFTLTVTNVNEAPTGLSPSSASVVENTTGKLVDLGATDPDASDTHTFTLPTHTKFEIQNDDELHLKSGQTLDFETTTSYTLSITATDAGSLTGTFNFTLTVTNVNEAPTGLSPSSASVVENTTGKLVDLGATDPDASDTHTFTLPTHTKFEIQNDDELHLKSGQTLDYETVSDRSHSLSITVTDAGSLTGTFTFTLTVTDNPNPTGLKWDITGNPSSTSFAEDKATSSTLATFSATDAQTLTYSITNPSVHPFTLNSTSGVLTLTSAFDYETTTSYSLTVRVTDAGSETADVSYTINVTNVDELPTITAQTGTPDPLTPSINEDLSSNPGAVLSTYATIADEDAGQTPTYKVTSGDGTPDIGGWEYKLAADATWTSFTSGTAVNTLTAAHLVRFVPNADANTVNSTSKPTLTLKAYTSSVPQESSSSVTVTMTVNNQADDPTITGSNATIALNEDENHPSAAAAATVNGNKGKRLSDYATIADVDPADTPTYQATPTANSKGTWQYKDVGSLSGTNLTDPTRSWTDFSAAITTLEAADSVRFKLSDDQNTSGGGQPTLVLKAYTSSTEISSGSVTLTVTITAVNDAPKSLSVGAPSVNEDLDVRLGVNTGSMKVISSVSDVEQSTSNIGIAISAQNAHSKGTWEYKTDASITDPETGWATLSIDANKVFLLAADDSLRFLAGSNANTSGGAGGTNQPSLTIYAWDVTQGSAGSHVLKTSVESKVSGTDNENDGSSLSSAFSTYSLTINPVDDPASVTVNFAQAASVRNGFGVGGNAAPTSFQPTGESNLGIRYYSSEAGAQTITLTPGAAGIFHVTDFGDQANAGQEQADHRFYLTSVTSEVIANAKQNTKGSISADLDEVFTSSGHPAITNTGTYYSYSGSNFVTTGTTPTISFTIKSDPDPEALVKVTIGGRETDGSGTTLNNTYTYSFYLLILDDHSPETSALTLAPSSGATGQVLSPTITIAFPEDVVPVLSKQIKVIDPSANSVLLSRNATGLLRTGWDSLPAGNTNTIASNTAAVAPEPFRPSINLAPFSLIQVEIDEGAFLDRGGDDPHSSWSAWTNFPPKTGANAVKRQPNPYGRGAKASWNFFTMNAANVQPAILSSFPGEQQSGIPVNQDIELTFNIPVKKSNEATYWQGASGDSIFIHTYADVFGSSFVGPSDCRSDGGGSYTLIERDTLFYDEIKTTTPVDSDRAYFTGGVRKLVIRPPLRVTVNPVDGTTSSARTWLANQDVCLVVGDELFESLAGGSTPIGPSADYQLAFRAAGVPRINAPTTGPQLSGYGGDSHPIYGAGFSARENVGSGSPLPVTLVPAITPNVRSTAKLRIRYDRPNITLSQSAGFVNVSAKKAGAYGPYTLLHTFSYNQAGANQPLQIVGTNLDSLRIQVPSPYLSGNARYRIDIAPQLVEQGNVPSQADSIVFITSSEAGTDGPSLASLARPSTVTDVATNDYLDLRFDEPIEFNASSTGHLDLWIIPDGASPYLYRRIKVGGATSSPAIEIPRGQANTLRFYYDGSISGTDDDAPIPGNATFELLLGADVVRDFSGKGNEAVQTGDIRFITGDDTVNPMATIETPIAYTSGDLTTQNAVTKGLQIRLNFTEPVKINASATSSQRINLTATGSPTVQVEQSWISVTNGTQSQALVTLPETVQLTYDTEYTLAVPQEVFQDFSNNYLDPVVSRVFKTWLAPPPLSSGHLDAVRAYSTRPYSTICPSGTYSTPSNPCSPEELVTNSTNIFQLDASGTGYVTGEWKWYRDFPPTVEYSATNGTTTITRDASSTEITPTNATTPNYQELTNGVLTTRADEQGLYTFYVVQNSSNRLSDVRKLRLAVVSADSLYIVRESDTGKQEVLEDANKNQIEIIPSSSPNKYLLRMDMDRVETFGTPASDKYSVVWTSTLPEILSYSSLSDANNSAYSEVSFVPQAHTFTPPDRRDTVVTITATLVNHQTDQRYSITRAIRIVRNELFQLQTWTGAQKATPSSNQLLDYSPTVCQKSGQYELLVYPYERDPDRAPAPPTPPISISDNAYGFALLRSTNQPAIPNLIVENTSSTRTLGSFPVVPKGAKTWLINTDAMETVLTSYHARVERREDIGGDGSSPTVPTGFGYITVLEAPEFEFTNLSDLYCQDGSNQHISVRRRVANEPIKDFTTQSGQSNTLAGVFNVYKGTKSGGSITYQAAPLSGVVTQNASANGYQLNPSALFNAGSLPNDKDTLYLRIVYTSAVGEDPHKDDKLAGPDGDDLTDNAENDIQHSGCKGEAIHELVVYRRPASPMVNYEPNASFYCSGFTREIEPLTVIVPSGEVGVSYTWHDEDALGAPVVGNSGRYSPPRANKLGNSVVGDDVRTYTYGVRRTAYAQGSFIGCTSPKTIVKLYVLGRPEVRFSNASVPFSRSDRYTEDFTAPGGKKTYQEVDICVADLENYTIKPPFGAPKAARPTYHDIDVTIQTINDRAYFESTSDAPPLNRTIEPSTPVYRLYKRRGDIQGYVPVASAVGTTDTKQLKVPSTINIAQGGTNSITLQSLIALDHAGNVDEAITGLDSIQSFQLEYVFTNRFIIPTIPNTNRTLSPNVSCSDSVRMIVNLHPLPVASISTTLFGFDERVSGREICVNSNTFDATGRLSIRNNKISDIRLLGSISPIQSNFYVEGRRSPAFGSRPNQGDISSLDINPNELKYNDYIGRSLNPDILPTDATQRQQGRHHFEGISVDTLLFSAQNSQKCRSFARKVLTIYPRPELKVSLSHRCTARPVTFSPIVLNTDHVSVTHSTTAPIGYTWAFKTLDNRVITVPRPGGGQPIPLQGLKSETYAVSFEGNNQYTATLEAIADNPASPDGCQSSIDTTFAIGILPVPEFTWRHNIVEGRYTTFLLHEKAIPVHRTPDEVSQLEEVNFYITETGSKTPLLNPASSQPYQVKRQLPKTALFDPVHFTLPDAKQYEGHLVVVSDLGCRDTTSHEFQLLPRVSISKAYFHDFNDGNPQGWFAERYDVDTLQISSSETKALLRDKKYEITVRSRISSWALKEPLGRVINSDNTDGYAWVTSAGADSRYLRSEDSWIYTPEFDISTMVRPTASFSLIHRFEDLKTGAVFQYSIDQGKNWQAVGRFNTNDPSGVNWYNADRIFAAPGGDRELAVGWSGNTGTIFDDENRKSYTSPQWVTAIHKLDLADILKGKKGVRFRFAFAAPDADITDPNSAGIGIDNFRIGTRSKIIVLEEFVTELTRKARLLHDTTSFLIGLKDALPPDVDPNIINRRAALRITYFGYPENNNQLNTGSSDRLYQVNPGDVNTRQVYYGIDKIPSSIMDGEASNNKRLASDLTDGDPLPWTTNTLDRLALELPRLQLNVTDTYDDATIKLKVDVTLTQQGLNSLDFDDEYRLFICITEDRVPLNVVSNPHPLDQNPTLYRNVMRHMLPDAAGYKLQLTNEQNKTYSLETSIELSNSFLSQKTNLEDLFLYAVAFVQSSRTKKIYQANIKRLSPISIRVLDTPDESPLPASDFLIYPNPVSKHLHVRLGDWASQESLRWVLLDETGAVLAEKTLLSPTQRITISVNAFPEGLYILRLTGQSSGRTHRRRFIIQPKGAHD